MAGEEQTQKSPWPVVALLQLTEHRSTGRWHMHFACYFQMIKVAALYFPCKYLNPILGLETCGSGDFPYKKSCFHTDKGVQHEILQNIDTEKRFFLKKKKKASNVTNPSIGNLAKKKSFLLVNIDRFLLPSLISSQEGQKSFS